jgi:uncharacterized protein (TIGR02231 family)
MKTICFFLIFVVSFKIAISQKNTTILKTNLKEVTVFLSGVQIERIGTVNIPEGNSLIVVTGLPADLIPQTLQVSGKGDFTILSVSHTTNYLIEQVKPKDIVAIEDSILKLKDIVAEKNYQLYVYNQEEAFILANKQIGGQNTGVSITALKESSDFLRVRLMDIKNKQFNLNKQISDLQNKILKYENQLKERNAKINMPTSEVLISVWANKSVTATFNIKYLSASASWVPSYDIKAKDINQPIQIVYKANIQQKTGEDWNGIKMTLSTANPFQIATKPTFQTWFLNFYQPMYFDNRPSISKKGKFAEAPSRAYDADILPEIEYATKAEIYTTQQTNMTTVEFVINKPYDIPSNGQTVAVEMVTSELTAEYEYFAYPKVNPSAYLIAKVTGWEVLNMIPGDIYLFFENTYVGKSDYSGAALTDTLDFSLGQDKGISIKREKIKEFSSKKIIGLNQRQSVGFKITVRNNKSIPVTLNLYDQLPVSTNKEIEVERIELSQAQVDDVTGKVYWKLQLKPNETKELKFAYAVKYPKDKIIILE